MKRLPVILALLVVVLGTIASTPALAWRGGHVRFGVFVGPGFWYPPPYYAYPPYYYPPYYYPPYYYPPTVITQAAPTYVEQAVPQQAPAQAAPAQPAGFWYYCDAAKGYYPYVKECPSGWQQVSPQPPN